MGKINNIFDDEFPSSFSDDPKAKKLPPNRIRKHTVTVRLNDFELKQVNDSRNQLSKSCWLRSSALQLFSNSLQQFQNPTKKPGTN
ncbi:hypothetical protein IFU37_000630 [Pantoea agglomerans]|uniref:hypothetical protein n=1 Tax=Enterobacter agglomerans TaxID=549 RepID=UPI001FCF1BFF|nr:hypothetical protein [Pantoea agglomerans]WVL89914.1 hypothetical protein IFU37_000630 [Pantoea agglomerans]